MNMVNSADYFNNRQVLNSPN